MLSNKHRLFNTAAATFVSLYGVVSASASAQTPEAQPILSNAGNLEAMPSTDYSAHVTLSDGRNITIHREAQISAQKSAATYFHKPLFAIVKGDKTGADHPIIHDKEATETEVFISLKFMLSNPDFRELARATIVEKDSSLQVESSDVRERNIDVRAWPIKTLRMDVVNSLTGMKYGQTDIMQLNTAGDQITISFSIYKELYNEFINSLNNDRAAFASFYTYANAKVASAQMTTQVSGQVSSSIDEFLASKQLKEGDPIFQDQALQLQSDLRQIITTTITANDPSLLAYLKPQDITSQILIPQTVTFSSLVSNPDLLAKVNDYLKPVIDKITKTTETTDEQNETLETTKNKSLNFGYGAAGSGAKGNPAAGAKDGAGALSGSPASGLSGDVKLSQQDVKTLEDKHKVVLTDTSAKDVMAPHSIEIYFLRKGWQSNLLSSLQSVNVRVGMDSSYVDDTRISASFTSDQVGGATGEHQLNVDAYAGVPKGIALCSFREEVPNGYIALNGKDTWPQENWVASHLRGKAIPDMNGAFIRGAQKDEEVGVRHDGGTLSISGHKIGGASYSLEAEGQGGVLDQAGQLIMLSPVDHQGWRNPVDIQALTVTGAHIQLQDAGAGFVSGYNSLISPAPIVSSIMKNMYTGRISGEYTIPEQVFDLREATNQPSHVNCNWIMRIR